MWKRTHGDTPGWYGAAAQRLLARDRCDSIDIIVDLDEACRRQQVGEAWFADTSQVPRQAISMSVRQILKAKEILAVVPDTRKAQAIKRCFEGEISSLSPASILRAHPNATVYLDNNSASLLSMSVLNRLSDESPAAANF